MRVQGASHATLVGVRAENNANYGVRVTGRSQVVISRAEVQSTGFRVGAGSDVPRTTAPAPGDGIAFEGSSSGAVCSSTVSGNHGAGIAKDGEGVVIAYHDEAFDNNPDVSGYVKVRDDCVDDRRGKRDDAFLPVPWGPSGDVALLLGLLAASGFFLVAQRARPRTIS